MSHLNGFYVNGFGKYFAIQVNNRIGGKVVTSHVRYVGKNPIDLSTIRHIQDIGQLKSIPLELLTDKNGKHIITPEDIQTSLKTKVANMGAIDNRTERWFRQWCGKVNEEELTIEDLENLVEHKIDSTNKTTKAILNLTTKEAREFQNKLVRYSELEEEAKKKADSFILHRTEDDEGTLQSTARVMNDEIDMDAEDQVLPQFDYISKYNNLVNKLNPEDFEDDRESMDWVFLQQKLSQPGITNSDLNSDEIDLIEKYHNKNTESQSKVQILNTTIRETPEMRRLKKEIDDFKEKNKDDIKLLRKLAENGQLDKIRVDMQIEYTHKHYMQDLQCIFSDTKEYQALKLIKEISKDKLTGTDKVKSLFIRENLELNSFDEIRNVYASHFAYKYGCEFVDNKGTKPIKLQAYEQGHIREFLNEATKSGYLLKQLKGKEKKETLYIPNFVDTIHHGKTSMLNHAMIDLDGLKKEAKEIAKFKLRNSELKGDEFTVKLNTQIEREEKKLMKKFNLKAEEHIKDLEKKYKKKFTKQEREKAMERAKKKIIKEFEKDFTTRKIHEITIKRLGDEKIKPGTKKYQEELKSTEKWFKKKAQIGKKKEELNLMRKYSLSKKSIARILTSKNLDYFESLHKANKDSMEKTKVQFDNLSKQQQYKIFKEHNINKLFSHDVALSREINENREKGLQDTRKTLYDRGIKNFQEYAFMLSLASMDNGTVLEGTRTVLEVFDVSKVFNN